MAKFGVVRTPSSWWSDPEGMMIGSPLQMYWRGPIAQALKAPVLERLGPMLRRILEGGTDVNIHSPRMKELFEGAVERLGLSPDALGATGGTRTFFKRIGGQRRPVNPSRWIALVRTLKKGQEGEMIETAVHELGHLALEKAPAARKVLREALAKDMAGGLPSKLKGGWRAAKLDALGYKKQGLTDEMLVRAISEEKRFAAGPHLKAALKELGWLP